MKKSIILALGLLGLACSGGSQQGGPPMGGFGGGGFGGQGARTPFDDNRSLDRTLTFHGTISLRDLPAWLTKQNVDFVIADPERIPDRKIVMNVNNKPLRDVLMSIGNAVGGFWIGSGEVYALRFLDVRPMVPRGPGGGPPMEHGPLLPPGGGPTSPPPRPQR